MRGGGGWPPAPTLVGESLKEGRRAGREGWGQGGCAGSEKHLPSQPSKVEAEHLNGLYHLRTDRGGREEKGGGREEEEAEVKKEGEEEEEEQRQRDRRSALDDRESTKSKNQSTGREIDNRDGGPG